MTQELTLHQRVMLAMEIADPFYVNSAHADAAIALVLDEAAKVALDEYRRSSSGEEIAAAIRALREGN